MSRAVYVIGPLVHRLQTVTVIGQLDASALQLASRFELNFKTSRYHEPKNTSSNLNAINPGAILDELELIFRRAVTEALSVDAEANAVRLLKELSTRNVHPELIKAFDTAIGWFPNWNGATFTETRSQAFGAVRR
jgi:hypothetical protein